MSVRDLLVEIGTEELPPKALSKLCDAFASGVEAGLKEAGLAYEKVNAYAAPRRLAVLINNVEEAQADRDVEKRGPAVKAAYDKDGNPTKAAQGFARGCGVEVSELDTMSTDKGEWLVFKVQEKGRQAIELIPEMVEQSLAKLPIPKRMRWGDSDAEFVRPVHWVVMLFGHDVIDAEILGIKTGRESRGHRFHHPEVINLQTPEDYLHRLQSPGHVMVDREARKQLILEQTKATAAKLGGQAVIDDDLLEEVTSLVEWPVAVAGDFDKAFLEVPAECLVSSMQDHQKYFPVVDTQGALMPHFITISNIESKDVSKVKDGNERVIRPRLGDAKFFWEQDSRKKLESHIEALDKVVFQQKLGSLGDKSRRVSVIAESIANSLGENADYAKRAAMLSKCDLMTEMVYEFTDLQGIMGRYYALNDGEAAEVADALDEQYMPRFAGDQLPSGKTGQILSLADKLDSLLGIFAIGQKPTGEKDPFALRRAALGALRILIECKLDLDLLELLQTTAEAYGDTINATAAVDDVVQFMLERLKVYYTSQSIGVDVYDAVLALRPTRPVDFDRRIHAVNDFRKLEQAESLAAANKRIGNILKKIDGEVSQLISMDLLQEAAEKQLHDELQSLSPEVSALLEAGDYASALKELAALRDSVDAFFDQVMVMAEDESLKQNRLALLSQLHGLFIKAADLSRLQS